MRLLIPVLALVLSGCSSSSRFFWNKHSPVIGHRVTCPQCAPPAETSIGSAVPDSMALEGGMYEGEVIHNGVIDDRVLESTVNPPMNFAPVESSIPDVAPSLESLPAPTPDSET